MKKLKNRTGISLIVLVITIIVMGVLAAAIILAISNSGIMDKAGKAKTESDTANLKEYVNILEAEWKLGAEEASDKTEYINTKLAEKGYNRMVTESGILLTEGATKAIKEGIQIGDVVTGYTLDSTKTSYTTSGKENTAKLKSGSTNVYEEVCEQKQTINQTEFITWKYVGISEDGELMILPDMISEAEKMILSGKGGYLEGVNELNKACANLYSVDNIGTARSMNIEDVIDILEYTGKKSGTWGKMQTVL